MRAIIILVPATSILEYLTGKRRLANIPEGAICTAVWMHTRWNDAMELPRDLAVRIEHESFHEVDKGLRIPFVRAHFRRLSEG